MSTRSEDEHASSDATRRGDLTSAPCYLIDHPTSSQVASSHHASTNLPVAADVADTDPKGSLERSTDYMEPLELLQHGNNDERISAANTLKLIIIERPMRPVLDAWDAATSLIDSGNPPAVRTAGWELLRECAKHASSTDLERQSFFQTLSAPALPEDFHLQLATMMELTGHGRVITGFDYDLVPLLARWLQEAYRTARRARKGSQPTKWRRSSSQRRDVTVSEEADLSQLFLFIIEVIKFSSNNADETSIASLLDCLLILCKNTSAAEDLKSCIDVLDALVTFGSIPHAKLKGCVQVLASIYSLVPHLQRESWHTLANLCKSHNGQATVRILLNVLRDAPSDKEKSKDMGREIKSALHVLKKLLSRTADQGFPMVPYGPLIDGFRGVLEVATSVRVYCAISEIIQSLFCDEQGQIHVVIIDEDWSACLDVAADCARRGLISPPPKTAGHAKDDSLEQALRQALLALLNRLDLIVKEPSDIFIPREAIINFFSEIHPLVPDQIAHTVLKYFQEFRCCTPSDLRWDDNLTTVVQAFYSDKARSTETRLHALRTIADSYEVIDIVGDGAEQILIPRLINRILRNMSDETDMLVLDSTLSLMNSIALSCDMELFEQIVATLKDLVLHDRLQSPLMSPGTPSTVSPTTAAPPNETGHPSISSVATRRCVALFLDSFHSHGEKSAALFDLLVFIAKNNGFATDARLTAMKLLFRLRADWIFRIFATDDTESLFLANALGRANSLRNGRQVEEPAQHARPSKADSGNINRPSRGLSLGQGSVFDRGASSHNAGHARRPHSGIRQLWSVSDTESFLDRLPTGISSNLISAEPLARKAAEGEWGPTLRASATALKISAWLDAVLVMLQESDWEVYSFVLVHLPSQLSNHALFENAMPQIKELRRMICEQICTNGFQEPPRSSGLRRADVAICLFHSLTMILSYHEYFPKSDEDEIVRTFVQGITAWERTAKYCIHALSICCHELPLSASKALILMLNQMAAIITQPHVSVHILEFLASLSRLHNVFVNFREEDYRIVFGICFRYLDYANDKRSSRGSHGLESSSTTGASGLEAYGVISDDLPQYVHALAYQVILFWFLALRLEDRARHVAWIVRKLFSERDAATADIQTLTSVDFLQRVTYADVDESTEDPFFTQERFGTIVKRQWLVGNSILTVKQATTTGWAQIIKRQPSGTSAYTIREIFTPPPPHQMQASTGASREGSSVSLNVLPNHLVVQLLCPVPQPFDSARPIPLPDDEATERAIRVFDRISSLDGHKVGVIYLGQGQTDEADILANVTGSNDYCELLNNLGVLTRLKGAGFNTQGLDREYNSDGEYTFCWRDRVTEIVFHVTTQMPTDLERDPHCTLKKRHIGNDFVNIIFNDSGLPFRFDTFRSQFNFVNIIITPASRASFAAARRSDSLPGNDDKQRFYRVQVMSKPGFPEVSPAAETKMLSLKALPGFVRLLALNASTFSMVWHKSEGGEHVSSWGGRLTEIRRLREKHSSAARDSVSSLPPSSSSGSLQTQQPTDASRPSSSVRDSISSLRRSSVATFFTSASEPPPRLSTLAAAAPINDWDPQSNGSAEGFLDSVDFSKWA